MNAGSMAAVLLTANVSLDDEPACIMALCLAGYRLKDIEADLAEAMRLVAEWSRPMARAA